MTQNQTLAKKPLAEVGEEIGIELGSIMVNDFQQNHPTEIKSFIIGRNIIDQILAQPNCAGIKIYNALNESGQKTLVYLGVDENGNNILELSVVNCNGMLSTQKGIVADRIKPGPGDRDPILKPAALPDSDNWGLTID